MPDNITDQELHDRLALIQQMLSEGRRDTESWGGIFVLWGVAYYIALAWTAWGHSGWAWPITVAIAVIASILLGSAKGRRQPGTTLSRAVVSIWIALGISMFLLFLSLGFSGRLTDQHVFMAIISAILGIANGASGLLLRWKAQLLCALAWWISAVITCFGSVRQSTIIFLIAIFLGQIVFGFYGIISESSARKASTPAHA